MNVSHPNPVLALSMLSLVGANTPYVPVLPVGWYVDIAQKSGFDGVEYWPIQPTSAFQVNHELLSEKERNGIISAHQSFTGQIESLDRARIKYGLPMAFIMDMLLENSDKSLLTIHKLQAIIKKPLPVVLYIGTLDSVVASAKLSSLVTQPIGEEFSREKIPSIDEYLKILQKRNLTICLDTHHFRSRIAGTPLENWKSALNSFLPFIQEVHISVGRTDEDDPGVDTMAELKALIELDTGNVVFSILATIKKSNFRGPYVVEIPIDSLQKICGGIMTPKKIIGVYTIIVSNLRSFLS